MESFQWGDGFGRPSFLLQTSLGPTFQQLDTNMASSILRRRQPARQGVRRQLDTVGGLVGRSIGQLVTRWAILLASKLDRRAALISQASSEVPRDPPEVFQVAGQSQAVIQKCFLGANVFWLLDVGEGGPGGDVAHQACLQDRAGQIIVSKSAEGGCRFVPGSLAGIRIYAKHLDC